MAAVNTLKFIPQKMSQGNKQGGLAILKERTSTLPVVARSFIIGSGCYSFH
jgi:hypothetical protein